MYSKIYLIKHKIDLYRRYLFWKKKKTIFIHIPKVAGTSINKAIYGRTLGHYTSNQVKSAFPQLFSDCYKFAVIRDPYERIYSAYKFAKVGKTNDMGVYKPKQYQIKDFDSFEMFLKNWLPKQNLAKSDFIFRPQVSFITNGYGELLVNDVFLLSDLKSLETRFGVNFKNHNSTGGRFEMENVYHDESMKKIVSDLYSDDIELFRSLQRKR
ncbi:sulfotransferase family 2 domain-containing protein [Vibrio sp. 1075]|uniref:sulfotransferase family 2 domain-containing protein n=1 Tax=Vibrio sp. 1075 TaxID=3074543 RepID=UPI002964CDEF|nr:sulfotransferase family 2 domain-containing protein [Vibrio sp. 1075]MDW2309491.1 sulfotransferase family 2 domain-containing protein [Vibrio sp. 1075]